MPASRVNYVQLSVILFMPPILRNVLLCALGGLPALSGCGTDQRAAIPTTEPAVVTVALATPFTGTRYHAYGDSITFGYLLPDPGTQAFPALIAQDYGLTLSDRAIGGRMACDVATQEIFPATESTHRNDGTLYSLLISTNDVNVYGQGAYESTFRLCHLAVASWLALPEEQKIHATDPSVSTSGSVAPDTGSNWGALITNSLGATVNFPLSLTSSATMYLWYHSIDGSSGTFAVALDSVDQAVVHTAAAPAIRTAAGTGDSLAVIRLPAVPAGTHTLTVRQTSTGPGGAWVVAAGVAPPPGTAGLPLLLIGTTPRYSATVDQGCAVNDAPCQAYIQDIIATVNTLAGDNLNVFLFDSRKYELGTVTDMYDSVHPNALGHQELKHAIEDILQ